MAMDYSKLYSDRLGGEKFGTDTAIYKFEKIKRARKAFEAAHQKGTPQYVPVINVGVGEHDGLEPARVSRVVAEEVYKKQNKGYPDNGILEFQQAAASYLNKMLGINLPTDEKAAYYIIH
jgi:LL-diaminopimelate aminotransferase